VAPVGRDADAPCFKYWSKASTASTERPSGNVDLPDVVEHDERGRDAIGGVELLGGLGEAPVGECGDAPVEVLARQRLVVGRLGGGRRARRNDRGEREHGHRCPHAGSKRTPVSS